MSRMAERAYHLHGMTSDADWMPTVMHAIERLDLLAVALPSDDCTEIATLLRGLFAPPTCRNCGVRVDPDKSYYAQRAVFCSIACREECLHR